MHRGLLRVIRSSNLLAVRRLNHHKRLPPPMDPSEGSDDYVHISGDAAEPNHCEAIADLVHPAPPNSCPIEGLDTDSSSQFDAEGAFGGSAVQNSGPIDSLAAESSQFEGSQTVEGGGGLTRITPEELPKGVVYLQCESSAEGGTCDVYLVGTAHISQESCREVREVIKCLKPQVVFLELCASRVGILTPQNLQVPTVNEMFGTWKKKKMNPFGILYSWFLAKSAVQLEVYPGSEFRAAFEEAISYGGKIILGDRPIQITLRRTWGKMSLWHRAKFLYYILFHTIFLPSPEDLNKMLKEMDDVDMLTLVIQEMSKAFPTLMETLLCERDLYMASTLLKVASDHSSVVAVVGKGHLAGIKKNWNQPFEVKDLLEIPSRGPGISRRKILTSVGIAAVAIASGLYFMGKR